MRPVGRHEGAAEGRRPLPRRRVLGLALGITATVVAWGLLVWEAIDFGSQARAGETPAWIFLGVATIGATACLFLTLILGTRVATLLRGEPQAPRAAGGRRASR
jgi:hypothetical protein